MAIKGKKHSSFATKVRIYELLKEHLELLDDNQCRYKEPNMNDQTIVKMVGDTTKSVVRSIRQTEFGNLKQWSSTSNNNILNDKIEHLTTALCATQERLQSLVKKHDTLCQSLSVNKLLDVRHLMLFREIPSQVAKAANGNDEQRK